MTNSDLLMRILSLALFSIFTVSLHGQVFSPTKLDELTVKFGTPSLQEFHEFLSLSNDANIPEQLEPNIQWVEAAFQKRGFQTKRLPTGAIDLVYAELNNPSATKTVLIYVQVDGQPVDPNKWFQETPFTPTLKAKNPNGAFEAIDWKMLEGDINPEWRVYARSTADAKGPINMFLAAMDAINAEGQKPNYNIKVIMDCEEELGSPNLPAAVIKYKDVLKADMLVILDGPMHPSNRPTLVFGARGIATVRLTTYGPRVPQHSGHYGNYVPNPAFRLMKLIGSMKDDDGRVTIPGFYDGIKITPEIRGVLKSVPDDEYAIQKHLGIASTDKVGNSLQEAIQYPSLNVRGMAAGWVGAKVRTIIPAAAVANIDVRLVKESDPEQLIASIRKHVEDQGYHIIKQEPTEEERLKYPKLISMGSRISYQAFRTNLDSPIGHWLESALTNTFGSSPIKIRTHGGSIPIAPFVNTLDVPAVIVPLVNPDNNQHSPNENVRLENYFNGVKTCIGILTENLK